MTLPILVRKPEYLLGKGTHRGYDWVVIHNGMGFRNGYIRVPVGHPWHGRSYDDIDCNAHGGLTYSRADVPTNKVELDAQYWWIGFDCAHAWDLQDPSLPGISTFMPAFGDGEIRTQEYVEQECRNLCEQAAACKG